MASRKLSLTLLGGALALLAAGVFLYWLFVIVPERESRKNLFRMHLDRARDLRDVQGNFSGAAAEVREALKVFPDDPEALLLMGRLDIDLRQFDEAIRRLEGLTERLEISSNMHLQAELNIGRAYVARYRDTLQRSDFDRARSTLSRVLRSTEVIDIKAQALAALFWLYLWVGQKDADEAERAKDYYDQLMVLAPDSPTAREVRQAYAAMFEREK
ncbi:MAG: tetratricopeptide repeat protein [Planctomycetota bacterium]